MKKKIMKICTTTVMAITVFTMSIGTCFAKIPSAASNGVVSDLEEDTDDDDSVAVDGTYVSLGADLSASEKATVLKLLDLSEEDLKDCTELEVTNADEHDYLDDYLDAATIGTRALSSVMISKAPEGDGITVDTENINYCTKSMYVNALITAGVEDAKVKVVGPFEISGTAGLVGVMKAYEEMTGEIISEDVKDAATNELVTTGQLSEELGADKATELLGLVKQRVVEEEPSSVEEVKDIVKDAASDLDVTLSQSQIDEISKVMDKIKELDIDTDALKEQAKSLYDKLKGMDIDIDSEKVQGFFDKIANWFKNLWYKIFD